MAEVRILYFAWLRERAGRAGENIVLPENIDTVRALMSWLGARNAGLAEAFAIPRLVRAAVNQQFASPETRIAGGDEIALFPPVTGG